MIQKQFGAPILATLLLAVPAGAQPAPEPAPAPNPDRATPAPKPDAAPQPPSLDQLKLDDQALDQVEKTQGDALTRDVVAEAMAKQPGGLTLDEVAERASATSRQVAAAQAQLRVSASRVDQAFASYFPKVTLGASYTRQSPVPNDIAGFQLPVIEDIWALTAQVDVPISDYLLRLTQAYAAADADVEARRLEVEAAKLQSQADAKIAYFNWVRAQGQAAVSGVGVALAERSLQDAKVGLRAGVLTEGDVARLEAQLANAQHLQNQANAMARVATQVLRTQMHLDPKARLAIGIDVLAEPAPLPATDLEKLKRKALAERLDLKALEETKESLEEVVNTTRASHYPRLDAFANGLYGNPNPRIFPQDNQWDFTWSAGVRLTWVVNDTFATTSAAREQQAQADAVSAQRDALADAIALEVTQAFYDLEIARSSTLSANQQVKALRITLEQRRRLFRAGNATATDIVDAEAQLIRAQLQRVDSHVDYLVAKARLELAVGGKL